MSELTLTIIRLGLLVLLWIFVFSVVGVLRGDIYGTRVVNRTARKPPPGPRDRAREQAPRPPKRQPHRSPTTLVVTEGPLRGTTLPLRESGTIIGRNPENALVLDDDFASGRHARIYRREDGWYVEDLGSTNGTFIGSQRLSGAARIDTGASLRIGKTVIELRR